MKILFVHPSNELYGSDRVLLEIIDAVRGPVNEIEVWLPSDIHYSLNLLAKELDSRDINYSFVNQPVLRRTYFKVSHVPKFLGQIFTCWKLLREVKPDLLYVNTTALTPVGFIGGICGIKTYIHVHEIFDKNARMIISPMIRGVSRFIAVSEAVKAALPKFAQRKTTVIYNGFDFEKLEKILPNNETVFLLASRWNAAKGHDTFLRSWKESNNPNKRLIIAGGPPPSGEVSNVYGLIQQLGIQDSIEVVGEVVDMRPLLYQSDVVVVPSNRPDSLPTIAIEALGAGRPVLASNIGGLSEIVTEGTTGWLRQAGNIVEWAETIDEICIKDLTGMEDAAHAAYLLRFSSHGFSSQIEAIIADALSDQY